MNIIRDLLFPFRFVRFICAFKLLFFGFRGDITIIRIAKCILDEMDIEYQNGRDGKPMKDHTHSDGDTIHGFFKLCDSLFLDAYKAGIKMQDIRMSELKAQKIAEHVERLILSSFTKDDPTEPSENTKELAKLLGNLVEVSYFKGLNGESHSEHPPIPEDDKTVKVLCEFFFGLSDDAYRQGVDKEFYDFHNYSESVAI